jgi:N6-L-threonylcarbamoyladenine synthase
MTVLGIETSCDDTCCGCVKESKVVSNIVATQTLHSKYGGVIPEIAARDHIKNIYKVVEETIREEKIDGIGVTYGPGLIGSLVIGLSFAKGLSYSLGIPFYGVNHLEAHIFSLFIQHTPSFPLLVLIVSGGHTELVIVKEKGKYQRIGTTLDDAVGESFDKVAKMIGLEYPGGEKIEKLAKGGDPIAVKLPHPKVKDYDFSFSGIKTACLYYLQKEGKKVNKKDFAASFQEKIVEILIEKIKLTSKDFQIKNVGIVGGVARNSRLREKILELDGNIYFPKKEYCTDNGAMVAICAEFYLKKGITSNYNLQAKPNLEL